MTADLFDQSDSLRARVLAACGEARLSHGVLPEFELRSGDVVPIGWALPTPHYLEDVSLLAAALAGRTAIAGLVVEPLYVTDLVRAAGSRRTVRAILRSGGCAPERLGRLAREYGMNLDTPTNALGGTPRLLVELETHRHKCNGICYSSGGLDPLGVETVRRYVAREMRQNGFIEIIPSGVGCRDRVCPPATLFVAPVGTGRAVMGK